MYMCTSIDTNDARTVDEDDGRLVRVAGGARRLALHRHVVHAVALLFVSFVFF